MTSIMPYADSLTELDTDARRELLTVLTAEHNNLQAARSAAVVEANGRQTTFFAALSGSLVALALIAQVEQLAGILVPLALVLVYTVLYVGLLTFVRLVQLTVTDAMLVVGINRIRHQYLELVPSAERSRVLSTHDDVAGLMGPGGLTGRSGTRLDILASAPGMVAGIDGVLAGVLIALVAAQLGASTIPSLGLGVVAVVATDAALFAYGLRTGVTFWRAHPPRHPTPSD